VIVARCDLDAGLAVKDLLRDELLLEAAGEAKRALVCLDRMLLRDAEHISKDTHAE
jgi:hypothetical protein